MLRLCLAILAFVPVFSCTQETEIPPPMKLESLVAGALDERADKAAEGTMLQMERLLQVSAEMPKFDVPLSRLFDAISNTGEGKPPETLSGWDAHVKAFENAPPSDPGGVTPSKDQLPVVENDPVHQSEALTKIKDRLKALENVPVVVVEPLRRELPLNRKKDVMTHLNAPSNTDAEVIGKTKFGAVVIDGKGGVVRLVGNRFIDGLVVVRNAEGVVIDGNQFVNANIWLYRVQNGRIENNEIRGDFDAYVWAGIVIFASQDLLIEGNHVTSVTRHIATETRNLGPVRNIVIENNDFGPQRWSRNRNESILIHGSRLGGGNPHEVRNITIRGNRWFGPVGHRQWHPKHITRKNRRPAGPGVWGTLVTIWHADAHDILLDYPAVYGPSAGREFAAVHLAAGKWNSQVSNFRWTQRVTNSDVKGMWLIPNAYIRAEGPRGSYSDVNGGIYPVRYIQPE